MTLQREPSTASIRERIDLSASGPRASTAAVGVSLHDIARGVLTGSLPRKTTKPCVCGGTIRADRHEPAQAVQAHNRSNLHRAWRESRGW